MRISYHDENPFESSFMREAGKGCAGCVGFLIWIAIIGTLIVVFGSSKSPTPTKPPNSPLPGASSQSR
jgi:hypothetical protein